MALEQKIPILKRKYNVRVGTIRKVAEADPTLQKKYINWLIQQYKNRSIRFPEDNYKVLETLKFFDKHKARFEQRDINRYKTYYDFDEVVDGIKEKLTPEDLKSKKQIQKEVKVRGASIVYDESPYKVIEIVTPQAAAIYARGTRWCTSIEGIASRYLKRRSLHVVFKHNKKYAQFHGVSGQLMNIQDRPLKWEDDTVFVREVLSKIAIKDPESACKYAIHVLNKQRWPEAEPYIQKKVRWAYKYTRLVLKRRWLEIEDEILKRPALAWKYAKYIMKDRWPEAEPAIMKTPRHAYEYVYFLKERVPGLQKRGPEARARRKEYAEGCKAFTSYWGSEEWKQEVHETALKEFEALTQ